MEYLIICLVSVVTAGLTFFSGFGLGTILMPVFALFFPVEIAIAATAVVHLANNFLKVLLVGRHADLKVVLLFAIPGALAAFGGALLLGYFSAGAPLYEYQLFGRVCSVTPVKLVISVLIIGLAILELLPFIKKLTMPARFIPLGGFLSGFLGGLSGHQGALRTTFLVRAGLEKKALVGTMVISAVVVDISRMTAYGLTFLQRDFPVLYEGGVVGMAVAASLAAFIGSFVGSRLLEKITLKFLHTFIAIMLIAIGLAMGLGVL